MGLFKREKKELTRIFIASDLHGSDRCFAKFLAAAEFYEADTLMIAGDLTGKMIVPIVRQPTRIVSTFQGMETPLGEEELPEHMELIADAGLYPYLTDPEEIAELEAEPDRVDAIFHRLVSERLEAWVETAEAKLAALDRVCHFVAGNDDYPEVDSILAGGERFKFIDDRRDLVADRFEVIGLGVANVTPWHAPRDLPEEEIAARLGALTAQLERPQSAIYLVHVPPADTQLDICPEIDDELRPVGAGDHMIHVGSTAVRESVLATQPLLTVHGHIHESRGIDKLGRTTCVNPGSEYGEGVLRGALVNLSAEKVESHLFVSG